MSPNELAYKKLVDDYGYSLASRTADLVVYENDDTDRSLFFGALLNAYWRGKASGVDECRQIVVNRKRTTETTSGKPTN